jgi:HK97 family phage prohead protease
MAGMNVSGIHRRDQSNALRRFSAGVKIREVAGEGEKKRKVLTMVASTSRAVDWGGYREVLIHKDEAISRDAAAAMLVNHDPNRIAGPITAIRVAGDQMEIDAELLPDARMDSGVSVADAIESGALRGVSIGYNYSEKDTQYDRDSRTLTVNAWRLLEVSLTPIPADDSAGLRSRSLPDHITKSGQMPQGTRMPFAQWLKARGFIFDKLSDEQADGLRALHKDGKEPAEDFAKEAREVKQAPSEAQRAADMKRDREIAVRAESQGLKVSDYLGMTDEKANEAMLRDLAEKNKTGNKGDAVVTITESHEDKQRDAVHLAMEHRVLRSGDVKNNPYAGRSIQETLRTYARSMGITGADRWSKQDLAWFGMGRTEQISGFRGAANISVASFPSFVMLNAITKIVTKGYEAAPKGLVSGSGRPIYSTRTAPDFKSFYLGGMGTANLQEVAENIAAPELVKTEGAYNDTLKMWAGTLSLSFQAMVNDDTGLFDASLRKAGPIAQKTREKRLVQKFLRGVATSDASTWTDNTTSGCTPVYTTADLIAAARANIGKANAALQKKVGLDGNPTGNMAAFYFAGPTSGLYLAGLLNQAPGQTVANSGQAELVVSPWLEATTITGYSTTSYYVVADPNLVDGLILTELAGLNGPQVMEYDQGSTLARGWKIFDAFEADLFWAANAAGTNIVFGAQQATT